MRIAIKLSLIAIVGLIFAMCNPKTNNDSNKNQDAENFNWLLGKWQRTNEEAGKETYEQWEKAGQEQYAGFGYTMQNGDTISQELMKLTKQEDAWKFIVITHADKQPTIFNVSGFNDSSFVCANDSNDFPKLITYWKDGENLKAKISGDGMEIPFDFKKIE